MADSFNVGQVFGDSAQGFANAAVAMPDAQASLALKQQQVQDYKDKSARDSKERDDLAKLANDPLGDVTTPEGRGMMMQHLAKTVQTFERNGDGIGATKAREDLINLFNKSSEIAKREQEEKVARVNIVGAIFGPVKTEEALAQAKELLKQTYPNEKQYYENLTLPQAQQIAAASKQWLAQQNGQSQIAEREERERIRQQEADTKAKQEALNERKAEEAKRHNEASERLSNMRARIQAARAAASGKAKGSSEDKKLDSERKEVQRSLKNAETQIHDTEKELLDFKDPTFEKELRKDERQAYIKSLEERKANLKKEAEEYRTMLTNTAPKSLPPVGDQKGGMSKEDQMKMIKSILGN